jgi:arylsulfatase A-like enzyme
MIALLKRYSVKPNEFIRWFTAFVSIAWLFRFYTAYHIYLLNNTLWPGNNELARGMASDALSAAIVVLISVFIFRLRILVILIAIIWCFFASGNHANIIVNDTNLSVFDLSEGTQTDFILGSALSHELLIRGFAALVLFWLIKKISDIIFSLRPIPPFPRRHWVISGIYLTCIAIMSIPFIQHPRFAGWSSCHMIEHNLHDIMEGEPSIPLLRHDIIKQFVYRDLNGTPIVKYPTDKRPNILILAIEGLSANMLDNGWTPYLAKRKKDSIYYNNFVATSDRTINGIYSMTCADYPRLYRRRWNASTESVSKLPQLRENLYCMPRIFSENGYHTIFMQAANLIFDHKRKFNRIAGFDSQYGKRSYGGRFVYNGAWGPNDASFFKKLAARIESLKDSRKPWLIEALTVGTHHPYIVPEDSFPRMPKKQAAFRYMDVQLEKLLNTLKDQGYLENTLVLITSDEGSWNTRSSYKFAHKAINASRGFMMVLTPDKDKAIVTQTFIQHDVPLSLADYVGIPHYHLIQGRSIFRHYASFRPILFGSTLRANLGGILAPREFISCRRRKASDCKKYIMESDDLYQSPLKETKIQTKEAIFFLQLASTLTEKMLVKPYHTGEEQAKKNEAPDKRWP